MFLDPAEPIWPSLLKSVLLLALVVASGAPVSWAIFGARPRNVWLGYTPVVGIGLHLLAANLASWIAPGMVGSWVGVAGATTVATMVTVRRRSSMGWPDRSRSVWKELATGAVLTASLMYVALANRSHVLFTDEEWHLPLAATMARGNFPPVSPFSPTFGAAYHYGSDLIAASLINIAGSAPWTAFFLVTPLFAVVFSLTATTAALDFGASRLAALCVGLIATFLNRALVTMGLPDSFAELAGVESLGDAVLAFGVPASAARFQRMGPALLNHPHYALGLSLVLVMAASLHAGSGRRRAVTLAVALALLPLAESSTFIIGATGVILYALVAGWRWSSRERRLVAAAVAGGLALAALGGGAITDALFRETEGAGTRLGLSPDTGALAIGALSPENGLNIDLGPLPIVVGLCAAALGLRSRGLGFLAATAVCGLMASQVLHFEGTGIESRPLSNTYTLAALGSVTALGVLLRRLRRAHVGALAGLVLVTFVAIPTAAPRLIGSVDLSLQGIYLGYPQLQDPKVRYANQTRFASALRDEWRALDWMRRELPDGARVLAANAPFVSMATGLPAPQSGSRLAVFNPLDTPLQLDALKFLARIDLEELGVTHLYATPQILDQLDARSRTALADPQQFHLLTRQTSAGGEPLSVYAIQPNAGLDAPDPASYRRLEALIREASALTVGGFLTASQRQTLLLASPGGPNILGQDTFLPRSSSQARFRAPGSSVASGLVVLHEIHAPQALGADVTDAVWQGHGLRAYSTMHLGWSRTWRSGQEPQGLPDDIAARLMQQESECELKVIGEPADVLMIGDRELELSGLPQVIEAPPTGCDAVQVAWLGSAVPPFIQARPKRPDVGNTAQSSAGLAFDGGTSDGIGVFHLWYRNPNRVAIRGGVGFQLYTAAANGLINAIAPERSVAQWLGPIEVAKERYTDRFEFDASSLTINGVPSLDQFVPLVDGNYVLALTFGQRSEISNELEHRRVVPLLQVTMQDGRADYRPLSGIVGVDE